MPLASVLLPARTSAEGDVPTGGVPPPPAPAALAPIPMPAATALPAPNPTPMGAANFTMSSTELLGNMAIWLKGTPKKFRPLAKLSALGPSAGPVKGFFGTPQKFSPSLALLGPPGTPAGALVIPARSPVPLPPIPPDMGTRCG